MRINENKINELKKEINKIKENNKTFKDNILYILKNILKKIKDINLLLDNNKLIDINDEKLNNPNSLSQTILENLEIIERFLKNNNYDIKIINDKFNSMKNKNQDNFIISEIEVSLIFNIKE